MDIDDEGVTDPSAEFGDLFEGQTVAFESELGGDVLGAIGHELNIGGHSSHHHHGTSHHPSDHEILSANLSFGADEYLQHQQIVIEGDNSEYMVSVPDPHLEGGGQVQGGQQIYVHATQEQIDQVQTSAANAPMYNYEAVSQSATNIPTASPPTGANEGVKVKEKVKRVKNVEYFTNENMERYLKRRGFSRGGPDANRKSISKAVFALSADGQLSTGRPKLISFGSKYDPECVIQELERFWRFYLWTKSKNHLVSVELLPILIPMLLHFYFQMMLSKMQLIARRMCVEFSKKFMLEDKTQENYEILVAVMKVSSPEIFKADNSFISLINRRYEFALSELTIIYLRQFLSKSNQPILLDLFTDRFKIKAKESKELIESIDWETLMDSAGSEINAKVDADDDDEDSESSNASEMEDTSHVRSVIHDLRNSTIASLPAISVYTTGDEPVCGAVSMKGTLIAYGLAEAGIRIFSVDKARDVLKPSLNVQAESEPGDGKYVCGHAGTVYGLHFHPKTKLLFSVGEDSLMRAWDLNAENPRCRAVYRGHTGPVWKLDIPNSGSMVATAGLDTTARIFVPERNEFVRVMVGHYFSVNCVKFHPNEAYIATGSADKSVRLWSINDGTIARIFTGVPGTVHAIAYHSSGKYLAGAGEGCKIVIWDLAEGEAVATLESLPNCKDLVFNGSTLTACYRNGMLQIYNLRPILGGTGESLEQFDTPPSISTPFTCQTFSQTLFKCYYKDIGMLYCLGSDLTVEHQEERQMHEEANRAMSNETDAGVTILHTVLQKPTVNESGANNVSTDNKSSNSDGRMGTSRILAARLSQPLSSSGAEDEITSVVEGESGNTTPLAADPPPLYRSSLDEAISSVIDQASEGCVGSGTITMYASN